MRSVEEIAGWLARDAAQQETLMVQLAHRQALAAFFGIAPGMCVLEIGCGQGEMTAVLADIVGPEGLVHAIDVGPEDYGAPTTLGEARDALLASPVGERIDMAFHTDPLDEAYSPKLPQYDAVILAHCAWYFPSPDALQRTMRRARDWGRHLHVAEWDIRLHDAAQAMHRDAVMVQAIAGSFAFVEASNVHTLLFPHELRGLAEAAGWRLSEETVLDAPDLQDGAWEVGTASFDLPDLLRAGLPGMPEGLTRLLLSQIAALQDNPFQGAVRPLSIYAFTAGRKRRRQGAEVSQHDDE